MDSTAKAWIKNQVEEDYREDLEKILLNENKELTFSPGGKLCKKTEAIVRAAKKLNGRLQDKKKFEEEYCDEKADSGECFFSEEEMYDVQEVAKAIRRAVVSWEKKQEGEQGEHEQKQTEEIKKTISSLKEELKEKEKAYEKLKKIFSEKKVKTIELAELESVLRKRIRQKNGAGKAKKIWGSIVGLVFVLAFPGIWKGLTLLDLSPTWSLAMALIICGAIFLGNIKTVPQNREWTISLLGKYLTTWEAGVHFQIPVFMKVDSKIFVGTLVEALYLDERRKGEVNSSKVDFADGSGEVVIQLFFRIFDTYKATYAIDSVVSSIKEKMEAGIRAYYGPIPIDMAIQTRAEVHLRKIISQGATEADKFKEWGVIIESLAVTDIKLPKELEEKRGEVLLADKDYEISKIDREKEKVLAETRKIKGRGRGEQVKSIAESAGISPSEALNYDLSEQRYSAWGKAGILIAGDSEGQPNSALTGAVAGAAAHIAADSGRKDADAKKPKNAPANLDGGNK